MGMYTFILSIKQRPDDSMVKKCKVLKNAKKKKLVRKNRRND